VTAAPAIASLSDVSTWIRGNGLEIVLFTLGAVLLVRLTRWIRDRVIARIDAAAQPGDALVRSEESKHRHTIAQALTWLVTGLIWAIAIASILARFGLPFTSLVLPVTVIGAALGIGAQKVVADLLNGIFIISERQYAFGDLVSISPTAYTDGATGYIEDITLRITRLRTADGEVVVIPNGQVLQVTNHSRDWARAVVDVPLAPGVDIDHANRVLHEVGEGALADEHLGPMLLDAPSVTGVESLKPGQVNVRLVARTLPGKQFEVARELRARVVVALQREGIEALFLASAEPTGTSDR
jgi:small-conductance mechanosensitive channel